jgi:hypothetical protein
MRARFQIVLTSGSVVLCNLSNLRGHNPMAFRVVLELIGNFYTNVLFRRPDFLTLSTAFSQASGSRLFVSTMGMSGVAFLLFRAEVQ